MSSLIQQGAQRQRNPWLVLVGGRLAMEAEDDGKAISLEQPGNYHYPAVQSFDRVAAVDEFAPAELLSEAAEHEDNAASREQRVVQARADSHDRSEATP